MVNGANVHAYSTGKFANVVEPSVGGRVIGRNANRRWARNLFRRVEAMTAKEAQQIFKRLVSLTSKVELVLQNRR